MEISTINYKDINPSQISLKSLDSKNYDIYYNQKLMFIHTPILKVENILDINSKTYLQLKISKKSASIQFINKLIGCENYFNTLNDNGNCILNSPIIRDLKNCLSIKVQISHTFNNIFDSQRNIIPYNSLKPGYNIKCIIHLSNFYTNHSNHEIGYSLQLYQLMIIQ
jgi:hypothetical protein